MPIMGDIIKHDFGGEKKETENTPTELQIKSEHILECLAGITPSVSDVQRNTALVKGFSDQLAMSELADSDLEKWKSSPSYYLTLAKRMLNKNDDDTPDPPFSVVK